MTIDRLKQFGDEQQLLNYLIENSNNFPELLLYDVFNKQGDNDDGLYNENKINVKDDTDSVSTLRNSGFKKFKHTPTSGNETNDAYVIYHKSIPMGSNSKPIGDIQDKNYSYINVYFSDIVKEPLLVEFNQGGELKNNQNKYYYHTWDSNGLYWKELGKIDTVLGDLLDTESDVYTQLTTKSHQKLLKLLKSIKNNLQKTIVFMIDKQITYYNTEITSSCPAAKTWRFIIGDKGDIKVENKTASIGNCFSGTNFKVYEHNFNTSISHTNNEQFQLRFIIPNINGDYDEITLYKNDQEQSENTETLYYENNITRLYVYFYGEDPRPLLLCYNRKAYKPKKDGDPIPDMQVDVLYKKWVKVDAISNLICQGDKGPPEPDTSDVPLLETLVDIIGYLNPVELNPSKVDSLNTFMNYSKMRITVPVSYEIHKFGKNKTIYMKINSEWMKVGYRKHKFEHHGTGNGPNGFSLGNVFYTDNKNKLHKLNYSKDSNKYNPLKSVEVCYGLLDVNYDYPFLIELKFNDGHEEFFRLDKMPTSGNYEWIDFEKKQYQELVDKLQLHGSFEKGLDEILTGSKNQQTTDSGTPGLDNNSLRSGDNELGPQESGEDRRGDESLSLPEDSASEDDGGPDNENDDNTDSDPVNNGSSGGGDIGKTAGIAGGVSAGAVAGSGYAIFKYSNLIASFFRSLF